MPPCGGRLFRARRHEQQVRLGFQLFASDNPLLVAELLKMRKGRVRHARLVTLATTGLHGPVNLVSPNPVMNAEFAATLGRVLGRPALVPVPSFALELLYGEMARATILAGQRVLPKALLRVGFKFAHPTLEEALRFELAR